MKGGEEICGLEDVRLGDDDVRELVDGLATIGVELAGVCEDINCMMCKNPYTRLAHGVSGMKKLTPEQRQAAMPFGCGRCLPCRINKARIWTHRILLEQMVSDGTCWCTFTYSDEFIPDKGSLKKDDYQKLIKRIRRRFESRKIRYFGVGEYGNEKGRPHYHIIFFNIRFEEGRKIQDCWNKGFVHVDELNEKTARYTAGYVTEKIHKEFEKEYFKDKEPEFMSMSKHNGGIGSGAIRIIGEKMEKEVALKDKVIRELKHGKRLWPLGRYLTEKLAFELDQNPKIFLTDLYRYQDEIMEKYDKGGMYLKNIIEDHEHKRYVQEKKHKLFKNRRCLDGNRRVVE